MLLKILFTGALIFGVIIFMRHKNARTKATLAEPQQRSLSPRMLAYGIVGVLLIASAVLAIWFETQA